MAYPFAPAFTFRELRDILCAKYGCCYTAIPNPGGKPVGYFERMLNGARYNCPVSLADDERPLPTVLRSILDRLGIPSGDFGMTLD